MLIDGREADLLFEEGPEARDMSETVAEKEAKRVPQKGGAGALT